MSSEIETATYFVKLQWRAARAGLSLTENYGQRWAYTLWLGARVVCHFDSLGDAGAFIETVARDADARDWAATVTDARTGVG